MLKIHLNYFLTEIKIPIHYLLYTRLSIIWEEDKTCLCSISFVCKISIKLNISRNYQDKWINRNKTSQGLKNCSEKRRQQRNQQQQNQREKSVRGEQTAKKTIHGRKEADGGETPEYKVREKSQKIFQR